MHFDGLLMIAGRGRRHSARGARRPRGVSAAKGGGMSGEDIPAFEGGADGSAGTAPLLGDALRSADTLAAKTGSSAPSDDTSLQARLKNCASLAQNAYGAVSERAGVALAGRRPLSEVFDRSALAAPPANVGEALDRIKRNAVYFRANYAALTGVLLVSTVVLNPLCLVMLLAVAASWAYVFAIRAEPIVVSGRILSQREKLVGMSAGSLVVLFLLSSVGYTLMYAVFMSGALCAVHGAMREPLDTFDDVEAPGSKSFLDQLTGQ